MPIWLEISIGVLGGGASATVIMRIVLAPAFKMVNQIKKLEKRMDVIEEHQENDFKSRKRSENLQKAQIKALIALLNNAISGDNLDMMKLTRQELQDSLVEHI